ncbi:MAG TPA: hypothetical protein VIK11_10170 [Tepidiformaceae bacterium]
MKRIALLVFAAVPAMAMALPVYADGGDSATLSRDSALIGQQVVLTLVVVTPHGATVDVDPGAESWNGIDVVRIDSQIARDTGAQTVHTLTVTVAPFVTGNTAFTPAVLVTADAVSTPRLLPPVQLSVAATLGPNDRLELSPLPAPQGIGGAESPLLRPGIVGAALVGVLLVAAGGFFGGRAVVRRLQRKALPIPVPLPVPDLRGAAALMEADPVAAYRTLASSVRAVISQRYGLAAYALTTGELQGRMEAGGIDRWQARLVGGLLQECDAVVYAGYRPAGERRMADLNMAREIVEAAG